METQVLACYAKMSEASSRMLRAAEEGAWDTFSAAENDCAGCVEELKALGDGAPLSPAAARKKRDLISKMLAEDAQIRRITQPWLERLETLLRGGAARRRVIATYG